MESTMNTMSSEKKLAVRVYQRDGGIPLPEAGSNDPLTIRRRQ